MHVTPRSPLFLALGLALAAGACASEDAASLTANGQGGRAGSAASDPRAEGRGTSLESGPVRSGDQPQGDTSDDQGAEDASQPTTADVPPSAGDAASAEVDDPDAASADVPAPQREEDAGPVVAEPGADAEASPLCESDELDDCEGGCAPASWLADGTCNIAFNCELMDFDGGDCVSDCGDGVCADGEAYTSCPEDCPAPQPAGNHPCETSDAPGSKDVDTSACVCALDAWCCTNTWDAFCVQLAGESCGAMCDCAEVACDDDAGCGACYGDLCIGQWSCEEGLCVQGEAVVCDANDDSGCLTTSCDPELGLCVQSPDDGVCDDHSACTLDLCAVATGECLYTPSEACGDQHPCLSSESPGAGSEATQACVCEVDSYCCKGAWDPACVDIAINACGLECECMNASADALSCAEDEDCTWCGETACTGPYVCVEGTCEASAPVLCDDAMDTACKKATCQPESGQCEPLAIDQLCDDEDYCTLDLCDGEMGTCSSTPIEGCGTTHPCQASSTPASKDEEQNACVCALDLSCCEASWSESCIALGEAHCGLSCECETLEAEALSCTEDSECSFCDDGDLCNGTWRCVEGLCQATPPVICDTSQDVGCKVTRCVSESGTCAPAIDLSLCDDDNPCTEEGCDEGSGACQSEIIAGCGENHPCVSAPFPTSANAEATACVCEVDAYCCTSAWDGLCVEKAEEVCEQVCTCDDPLTPVECIDDAGCAGCDDGDLCNGTWGCVEGLCTPLDTAIVCDASDTQGCLVSTCMKSTGTCDLMPVDDLCDDGDPCTLDSCGDEGTCSSEPIEGCSLAHPCAVSSAAGSSDPAITACVCAIDSWCCDNNWDSICVGEAETECGAVCDCSDPSASLSCETDAECAWCTEDLCDAPWSCEAGQCVMGEAVTCDTSADTACLINQCDPSSGACVMGPDNSACDDDDPCTMDSCDPEGVCVNEALEGCEGVPPFPCLGVGEPSAEGCGIVESYAGCCDPWGRVTWCESGMTYCISCQENPSCGWQSAQGYYDCGNAPEGDPSGEAPMMCPAFAP